MIEINEDNWLGTTISYLEDLQATHEMDIDELQTPELKDKHTKIIDEIDTLIAYLQKTN